MWSKIILVGGGIFGAIFLYGWFKKGGFEKLSESGAGISNEQATIYSNQLFQAMQEFGTDEDVILGIFDKITSADFKKIYNLFGRKGHILGHNDEIFGFEYDLVEWLNREIGNGYDKINRTIRGAGFQY